MDNRPQEAIMTALDRLFPSRIEKREREAEYEAAKERMAKAQERAKKAVAALAPTENEEDA